MRYTDDMIEAALAERMGLDHTFAQLVRGDTMATGYSKVSVVRGLLDALEAKRTEAFKDRPRMAAFEAPARGVLVLTKTQRAALVRARDGGHALVHKGKNQGSYLRMCKRLQFEGLLTAPPFKLTEAGAKLLESTR